MDGFTGDCDNNGQIDMSRDKSCTANFSQVPVTPASVIRFAVKGYKVKENNGIANITVTRTGNDVGEISVDYTTTDNTAQTDKDYQAAKGTLVWRAGEHGEKTFTVNLIDNDTLDGDKSLILSLGNLTGASAHLATDTATLTIVDDEIQQQGALQFVATVEVDESTPTATLTISRLGGHDGKLVVNYTTTNGTAIAGSDYVKTTGKLTWTEGDSDDKTVEVALTEDTLVESDETFTFNLTDNATHCH